MSYLYEGPLDATWTGSAWVVVLGASVSRKFWAPSSDKALTNAVAIAWDALPFFRYHVVPARLSHLRINCQSSRNSRMKTFSFAYDFVVFHRHTRFRDEVKNKKPTSYSLKSRYFSTKTYFLAILTSSNFEAIKIESLVTIFLTASMFYNVTLINREISDSIFDWFCKSHSTLKVFRVDGHLVDIFSPKKTIFELIELSLKITRKLREWNVDSMGQKELKWWGYRVGGKWKFWRYLARTRDAAGTRDGARVLLIFLPSPELLMVGVSERAYPNNVAETFTYEQNVLLCPYYMVGGEERFARLVVVKKTLRHVCSRKSPERDAALCRVYVLRSWTAFM